MPILKNENLQTLVALKMAPKLYLTIAEPEEDC